MRAERRPPVTSHCLFCSKAFSHRASHTSKFCSRACCDAAKQTRPKNDPRACFVCGTVFKPARHRGDAKHCSRKCQWVSRGGVAFNTRIARESVIQRGNKQRGTGTRGYVKRNGRHEHRVVAEEMLGRKLTFQDVIHHKDGNKHNNSPENLQLTTRREHMPLHGIGIPGVTPAWKPWMYRKKKNP